MLGQMPQVPSITPGQFSTETAPDQLPDIGIPHHGEQYVMYPGDIKSSG